MIHVICRLYYVRKAASGIPMLVKEFYIYLWKRPGVFKLDNNKIGKMQKRVILAIKNEKVAPCYSQGLSNQQSENGTGNNLSGFWINIWTQNNLFILNHSSYSLNFKKSQKYFVSIRREGRIKILMLYV